jgi:hypothetical protein
MKPAIYLRNALLLLALFTLLAPPLALAEPVKRSSELVKRSCIVKETQKGGMYVYIRCSENGKEIWMATVAREFKQDEQINFVDAPPMINFYSKYLNRTFPEVIFTDLLPSGATPK